MTTSTMRANPIAVAMRLEHFCVFACDGAITTLFAGRMATPRVLLADMAGAKTDALSFRALMLLAPGRPHDPRHARTMPGECDA